MKSYTILLVEDDATLLSTLSYNLTEKNWQVDSAASFAEADQLLAEQEYDLVILDINLPDGNGFTLCRKYRQHSNKPVIFLTANDMEMDELHGYDLGADDYVTKPFSVNVLSKKVEAILKRLDPQRGYCYNDGFLTVDFERMQISIEDQPINLSALEFKTLRLFIENAEIVLTRSVLLEKLWDSEEKFVDEHALTMGISRLRKKIELKDRKYIKTIYGLGYLWLGERL